MNTDCNSCDAHMHHAAESLAEIIACEDNSFDNPEEAMEFLDRYAYQHIKENRE